MGAVIDGLRDLDIKSFIYSLEEGGWYEFVFPFLLVYAVVFTVLNQVDLFQDKKPVKVIIALVFSLFAIAFPVTGEGGDCGSGCGQTLGDLMMSLFPGVTAFAIGILALYIVAAMLNIDLMKFFGTGNNQDNWLRYVLGGLGLIVVVYYYGLGFEWWGQGDYGGLDWLLGHDGLLRDPALYMLIAFGGFFWWISKDDAGDRDKLAADVTKARNSVKEAEDSLK